MKINSGSAKPISPAGVQDVVSGKASSTQASAGSSAARDKVQITSLSAQLQQLESVLSDVSVVDSARVDAIKQAISEGRFQIDSEVVADRLLATVREHLLSQKA